MDFVRANGQEATGEVWSPGPVPKSVWVLMAEGPPRAVRLATKDKPAMEVIVSRVTDHTTGTTSANPWTVEHGRRLLAWRGYRLPPAPPLSQADWRRALAS